MPAEGRRQFNHYLINYALSIFQNSFVLSSNAFMTTFLKGGREKESPGKARGENGAKDDDIKQDYERNSNRFRPQGDKVR